VTFILGARQNIMVNITGLLA